MTDFMDDDYLHGGAEQDGGAAAGETAAAPESEAHPAGVWLWKKLPHERTGQGMRVTRAMLDAYEAAVDRKLPVLWREFLLYFGTAEVSIGAVRQPLLPLAPVTMSDTLAENIREGGPVLDTVLAEAKREGALSGDAVEALLRAEGCSGKQIFAADGKTGVGEWDRGIRTLPFAELPSATLLFAWGDEQAPEPSVLLYSKQRQVFIMAYGDLAAAFGHLLAEPDASGSRQASRARKEEAIRRHFAVVAEAAAPGAGAGADTDGGGEPFTDEDIVI